jgi:hypothetical protein
MTSNQPSLLILTLKPAQPLQLGLGQCELCARTGHLGHNAPYLCSDHLVCPAHSLGIG